MQYLIRYGELALKSLPVRKRMETILVQRIREAFTENVRIRRSFGRIFVDTSGSGEHALGRVFGIVSFSLVTPCQASMPDLCQAAVALLRDKQFTTFAVAARRTGTHDFSSHDIQVQVGDAIRLQLHKKVNLSHPDVTISIEVREKDAYLFTDSNAGLGGYPLGAQGRVACLIRTPADELACWLMMRKGCTPILVGKPSKALAAWGAKVHVPDLAAAKKEGALAVVSSRQEERTGLPVFTPLLGMPKEDVQKFRKTMRATR